jgi:hypothetical protein
MSRSCPVTDGDSRTSRLNEWSGDRAAAFDYAIRVDDTLAFRIGVSNREHLIVRPTRRERPAVSDYWDGNWVYAFVEIAAGGFRGKFEAQLRAEEFVSFRDQLRPLGNELGGAAKFEPMEPWLRIDIKGDGKGHFLARCEARDQVGTGNKLTFTIDFDQTELSGIVQGLDAICEAFPIVGSPPPEP